MANAGSGKTSRLTDRVVRLLLLGVVPERIVCITYTKAAANEMRSRVLNRLRELLLAKEDVCKALLADVRLLGRPATPEELARARGLFASVLDSSSGGLHLTTIHGFCQNILRRFPVEADIAPHFTVLEDAVAEDVLRRTKYALLSGIAHADDGLKWALDLIGTRGGETRFETIANDIVSKRRLWRRVWHLQSETSLRAHLFSFHGLDVDATRATLERALCMVLSAADAATLRSFLPRMLAHKKKTENKYAQGFARWLEVDEAGRLAQIPDLCQLILTKGELRADIMKLEDIGEGDGPIERLAQAVKRFSDQLAALACAEESFAVAILARALLEDYEFAKLAQHALDYDDLIDKTLELCTRPDMIGWVMSKLDHRIDHLLIDEAQDNSPEQWKLAHVLVEELIASNEGVGSGGHPRSLLVVGDEKQSIYSFQGAAPEEFSHYHGAFDAMLAGSPSPLTADTLSHSYRSTQAVLTLVDHVSNQPAMRAALSAVGQVPEHQLTREKDAGRVVLYSPIIAPEKEVSTPLVIPTAYTISSSAPQQLAESIAETLAQWFDEKRLLTSKGRMMRAGDILILVHRRKPLMQPLIRALQKKKIPVAGIDRLTLSDHLAVSDLLALMRWCGHAGDDLALAQVLRSPLIGMSDADLRAVAFGRAGPLWNEVTNPWLAQLRQQSQSSPYDFLTHVLEVSGKRVDFARRFGAEVHEVLDELKAQAAAMPTGMPCTLTYFVDWMEKNTRQIKREQETNEADHVRIMTVHGAKGLEAPVVLLVDTVSVPDTGREVSFSMKSAHGQELPLMSISPESKDAPRRREAKQRKHDKLLAEYNRLLYVALTRARDELHIFGTASKKGDVKRGSWYETVATSMRTIAAEEGELLVLVDVREPADTTTSERALVETTAFPSWLDQSAMQELSATATLSPSGLEVAAPSPYAVTSSRSARQRGVQIHRVLELLEVDADAAHIAKLVKHIAPDWNAKEQADIVANITALVGQEPWLWAHERFAEVNVAGTVTHQGAQIPFSGQIDLLVKTPEEIIIVDYKTGAHIPQFPCDVSRNYLLQLKIYRELVRQIYPALPVRCALLWTAEPRVMWVDDAVETTQFPDKNVMDKTTVAA